ncbi:MAG: peptide deformylase [Micrococcales bacterium]
MAVRDIRLFGDPVLKTSCDAIRVFDSSIKALAEDLIETTKLPGRAGVAAPQIGVNLRAFSFNVNGRVGVVFNPTLVETSGPQKLVDEGCLSVPGLWHKTPRFEFARVEGFDQNGEPVEFSGNGLLAQALQHECDHLDGILYLDRLELDEKREAMKALRTQEWFLRH